MTVRRNWVIVVLLLAGGLYYWSSNDEPEAPPPVSQQTAPQRPAYSAFPPPLPRDRSQPPASAPESYLGFDSVSPPALPRFRPLQKSPTRDDELQPLLTYPGTSDYRSGTGMGPDFAPSPYGSYQQPQLPAAPEYKFRPQDFSGKSRRWTGNYPQYPGSGQIAPMRPGGPQFPAPPALPRQQSSPPATQQSLWADTRTLGR